MKIPAIILRTQTFRESDLLFACLSPERGRFSCIARGGARSKQRFPGGLDLWDAGIFEFRHQRKNGLEALESVSERQRAISVREDLTRFSLLSFATDLILQMTEEEHEEDGKLFTPFLKLVQLIQELPQREQQCTVVVFFTLLLLRQLGYDICAHPEELNASPSLSELFSEMLTSNQPIVPYDTRLLLPGFHTLSRYIESILGKSLRTKEAALEAFLRF